MKKNIQHNNIMKRSDRKKQHIDIICRGCTMKGREHIWEGFASSISDRFNYNVDNSYLIFEEEPSNEHDPNAIMITCKGEFFGTVGYVGKEFTDKVREILKDCKEYRIDMIDKSEVGNKEIHLSVYWNSLVQDHLGQIYPSEKDMCEKYGISQPTFYQRYHVNKWSLEEALTLPVGTRNPRMTKQNKEIRKTQEIIKEVPCILNEEFIASSNYPSEEYIKYLKHIIEHLKRQIITDSLVKDAVTAKIRKAESKIMEISDDVFFYKTLDLIYAGELSKAQKICSKKTLADCLSLLSSPTGIVEEIYVFFASDYHIENKIKIDEMECFL